MPIKIGFLKEKVKSCPHYIDVYCQVNDKIIECHMDKIAHCLNCIAFKFEE
ncbi:hypothetical protein GF327_07320 [Candidatus Woesearchaeota archaeon]|nr:hypothetical protein [Candidatus Woesearchaeota archaeon]